MSYAVYKNFSKKANTDPQTKRIVEELKRDFDWGQVKRELEADERLERERQKKKLVEYYNGIGTYNTTISNYATGTKVYSTSSAYAGMQWIPVNYPDAVKPEIIPDDSEEVDFNG